MRVYDIPSSEGFERTLRVYAPRGFRGRMPVLYLHDGQNVFDADAQVSPSWGVDLALDRWIAAGGAPWIAVGIDHRGVERIGDDSPWPERSAPEETARGVAYARFVAEEATAFIDSQYRTVPSADSRALVGSSLGGLMTLFIGARHRAFGRLGAFSPTTMWGGDRLFGEWREETPRPERLYLDVGEKEYFENGETKLAYGADVPRFVEHLRALGYGGDVLRFVVDEAGEHNEADWRRRFPEALPFLLGGSTD